jgi:hypothetical protein
MDWVGSTEEGDATLRVIQWDPWSHAQYHPFVHLLQRWKISPNDLSDPGQIKDVRAFSEDCPFQITIQFPDYETTWLVPVPIVALFSTLHQ